MKRRYLLVLALIIVALISLFSGCSTVETDTKTFEISDAETLSLMSGNTGKMIKISDSSTISQITENINSLELAKDKSGVDYSGWSYRLRWYNSDGEIIEDITIQSSDYINYSDYFWSIINSSIDTKYFDELLSLGEMPADFAIYFSCWIDKNQKSILDTNEGYIQKDLVLSGVATADYSISDEVLRSIYEQIVELDLISIERVMTSEVLTTDNIMVEVMPCTYYEIRFTIDGTEHSISGDATAWSYRDSDDDVARFISFVDFMNDLMQSSEEYQSLPEHEGGYE